MIVKLSTSLIEAKFVSFGTGGANNKDLVCYILVSEDINLTYTLKDVVDAPYYNQLISVLNQTLEMGYNTGKMNMDFAKEFGIKWKKIDGDETENTESSTEPTNE